MFEAGRVFLHDPSIKAGELTVEGFAQPKMIGGLAYGPALEEQWGAPTRTVDFFDVKGDLEAAAGTGGRALREGGTSGAASGTQRAYRTEWPRSRLDWRIASALDAKI